MMFSSVVFPVPFFATRATRRPSSIVNEIFSKSTCSPYDLVRFSTWRQEAITCDLDLQSYAKIPNRANRRPGKGPRPPENGLPLPEKRTAHDGHIPSCAVSRCRTSPGNVVPFRFFTPPGVMLSGRFPSSVNLPSSGLRVPVTVLSPAPDPSPRHPLSRTPVSRHYLFPALPFGRTTSSCAGRASGGTR